MNSMSARKVGCHRRRRVSAIASELHGLGAVALWAEPKTQRRYRIILNARDSPIISLLAESDNSNGYRVERHLCIDTTIAGGDASLLEGVDENNI